jgi:hypothetical protein
VGHNVVCSHTGWTSAASLTFRRASLAGVQITIAHNRPMTFWVNASRRSTAYAARGSVPFWGSSSAIEETFVAIEVYSLTDPAGAATFVNWVPQSGFSANNPGTNALTQPPTSVQVNIQSGPTFPVGTQVFLMAGVGTRHTLAASYADLTVTTVNDWVIDSISMWA